MFSWTLSQKLRSAPDSTQHRLLKKKQTWKIRSVHANPNLSACKVYNLKHCVAENVADSVGILIRFRKVFDCS